MRILILNGSPRLDGNTKKMINAFTEGAESAGHHIDTVDVCRKR
ncbi:MAG: NAD(P)H-dependent oxidoreductase, partial [Ruminiclostridium sp.]|nr:NAD(P)H-dependent oxidoreductase [Ruminiclostridium sp.]